MPKWYVFKVITGSEKKINKIIGKELEKGIGFTFVHPKILLTIS